MLGVCYVLFSCYILPVGELGGGRELLCCDVYIAQIFFRFCPIGWIFSCISMCAERLMLVERNLWGSLQLYTSPLVLYLVW